MNELDENELDEFQTEAFEMLESGESGFLAIESGGDFNSNYDSVFRVFHSLKGAAGMLGMETLQGHMHRLENHLTKCKEIDAISSEEVTYFLSGIDAARKLMDGDTIEFEYIEDMVKNPPAANDESKSDTTTNVTAASNTVEIPTDTKAPIIYVVDDEESIGEVVQIVLEEAGISVTTFTKGQDLLDKLKDNHSVDAVVTDFKMPGMDGLELTKKVREIDANLPVILLSAHVDKDLLLEFLKQNAHAALEKPFDPVMLLSTCMTAIKKRQMSKLLDESIRLVLFQFSDIENFLKSQGKEILQKSMRADLNALLESHQKQKHNI